jgi:phage replication O-like protein O
MNNKPQLENGYLRIACGKPENDILLALARTGLNGTQFSICLVIIRKTWGYQKQWDWISYTTFEKLTNSYRANISRELKKLIVAKILLVDKSNPRRPRYKFNKNFNEWDSSELATSSQKATKVVAKKLPKVVAKKLPTKEKKDNNKRKGFEKVTVKYAKSYLKSKQFRLERDQYPTFQSLIDAWKDYHISKGTKIKDYKASFRTWCRNATKFGGLKIVKTLREKLAEKGEYEVGSSKWLELKNKQKEEK